MRNGAPRKMSFPLTNVLREFSSSRIYMPCFVMRIAAQDFDRHLCGTQRIPREIHIRHAAAADEFTQEVLVLLQK
jgi:hypothetical protein